MTSLERRGILLRLMPLLAAALLIIVACGGPAAPAAQNGAQTTAPSGGAQEATAAPAGGAATTAPAAQTGGAVKGIMTISTEQQATWVRNFNPFAGDRRWPAREGMYEPLMVYNTIKGELVPWLATEYKWSDDNKKLTFTTHDNVKWSDGQPFSAKDVAFTFNLFNTTKGLQGPGSNVWDYLAAVNAPDDKTVEFSFKKVFT